MYNCLLEFEGEIAIAPEYSVYITSQLYNTCMHNCWISWANSRSHSKLRHIEGNYQSRDLIEKQRI